MDNEMRIVARHMAKAPVDLPAIFQDLGIDFQTFWMDEASGWIERDGEKFTVAVNAVEPNRRQRFTAAHELAHYLLHRDLMDHGGKMHRHTDQLYDGSNSAAGSPFNRQHEIQANRLAAQIIMPASLVREKYAENEDLASLAEEFDVSKLAMEIRLKTLGLIG